MIAAVATALLALPPAIAAEDPVEVSTAPASADGIVGEAPTSAGEAGDARGTGGERDGSRRSSDPDSPEPGDPATAPETEPTAEDGDEEREDGDRDGFASKAGGGCPNTTVGAQTLTNRQIAKSIVCLVNEDREDRGRPRLRRNGDLDQAARRHSKVMEEDNCFEHACPGEPGLGKRVRRSGYLDGAERWGFAESIGCSKTTQGMLDAWLASDFNRRNLRRGRYRDVGAGIVHGSPTTAEPLKCPDTSETATYTLVFAYRKG